ncbi:DUF6074 family protein [Roseitalea porphyridii]|uniref:Uncharacterized protein n=1 Tax=Roseitalea porphyridii TaxID=1852022 RepID=A0A4V1A3Y9_9HYPH|nr:DUF6074 family protein [Roseitalea porphyridii]QBK30778.1 hypothetical protein E0E05_09340 [Roseitalea porphyridii]
MSETNLPLFNWQPAPAVIAFPADRWIGKARHVATVFMRQRNDTARERYWRDITSRMVNRLIDAGVSSDEANRQIELFCEAVQREIDRRTPHDQEARQ